MVLPSKEIPDNFDDKEQLRYIMQMLIELADIARNHNFTMLFYLMSMAVTETNDILRGVRPATSRLGRTPQTGKVFAGSGSPKIFQRRNSNELGRSLGAYLHLKVPLNQSCSILNGV
jgi:hypothetical protein